MKAGQSASVRSPSISLHCDSPYPTGTQQFHARHLHTSIDTNLWHAGGEGDLHYAGICLSNMSDDTVTASIWASDASIVSMIYTGRPYFLEAMDQGNGASFGIAACARRHRISWPAASMTSAGHRLEQSQSNSMRRRLRTT